MASKSPKKNRRKKAKPKRQAAAKPYAKFLNIIFRLGLICVPWLLILIIYSDAEIEQKFVENRWLVPAKIYARPLVIQVGDRLTVEDLLTELKLLNYRPAIKAHRAGLFEQYDNDFTIFTRGFAFPDGFRTAQKLRIVIENQQVVQSYAIDSDHADSSNRVKLEPLLIDRANPLVTEDRELVAMESVPPSLVDALIVSEDRNFYDHFGISLRGIMRAASQNFSDGKVSQGGSTLTQQLVKNYFLTNKRSYWRKLREAIMAVLLEVHYSKDDILQAYINEVYLGQNGAQAIHGFAKASRYYFDRELSQISLAQAATLVALVRGPSFYEPRKYPGRVLKRRNLILDQMLAHDRITESQRNDAKQRSLSVVPQLNHHKRRMPAVMDLVRRQLKQNYSTEQLNHNDLAVFTSIDPLVQRSAEKALSRRIDWLENNYPTVPDKLQGALVVSDRFNGDVKAIVGDRTPEFDGFNRALFAYRQTGSAIKPFVYATALTRAAEFSLVSLLEDREFSLTATDGTEWKPKNYKEIENGTVELQEALAFSYNLSTARLAMSVGIPNIIDTLYDIGFDRSLYAFPSLALGAQEMSPWEMLRLYQTFASDGLRVETSVITSVLNAQGELLHRFPATARQVVNRESVFLTNQVLKQVVEHGTAKFLGQRLNGFDVAGKTGTTDDLKDSWFAGFSENYLAVAWVGKDDNSPTGLTGASGAMQVWGDLIGEIEYQPLVLSEPDGIEWAESDKGLCTPFIAGFVPARLDGCR